MACGSASIPHGKLADSEAAISAAEAAGANEVPRASLHTKLAKDQLEKARGEIKDGDTEEATLWIERAKADAELALSMARSQADQQRAQQALAEVEELRSSSAEQGDR
jgi:hypothetical protein